MADLLAGVSDNPLAALQRQQAFWRYSQHVSFSTGPGSSVPYLYLGNIKPEAIAVGPQSWIDAYRVWYVPTGRPQNAAFLDVAIRAPLTSPVDFLATSALLTGGSGSPILPGLYVYLGNRSLADTFDGIAANAPLGARNIDSSTVIVDLLVYFQKPAAFTTLRSPLTQNSYAQSPGALQSYSTGTVALTGALQPIWEIPTYGRRRVNWSLTAIGGAATYTFYGQENAIPGGGSSANSRIIHTATAASGVTESFVLNSAQFDQCALEITAGATATDVEFRFEATDD